MPSTPALRYRLSVADPVRRLLGLSLELRAAPGEPLVLALPAWTPGSYLIREYARHVEGVEARDGRGRRLAVRRLTKDRWEVAAPRRGGKVRIAWRVYANELSVRTCHVDDTHAFVQPTAVFLCPAGMEGLPVEVAVSLPAGWTVSCSLPRVRGTFRAPDQETLHDSPVHMGILRRFPFRVRGVPHELVLWGESNADPARLVRDLSAIVEAGARMFRGLPYGRFVVQGLMADAGGGGLEHRDGFVFMLPRWSFAEAKDYDRCLVLLAHEFFHAWNVRRIRPAGLLPYDLSGEKYTRLLWLFEGVTDYYAHLLVRRAGLREGPWLLDRMAEKMKALAETPGRRLMALDEASVTTWVKFYRPDENTGNAAVSYYLKGLLAGLALDLHLRAATGGKRSLDDVLRLLWRRHRRPDRPVPEDAVPGLVREATGVDAGRLLARLVEGTADPDWESLFAPLGVEVARRPAGGAGKEPGGWIGAEAQDRSGRTVFRTVRSDGPAAAGVAAGDELVALDGWRCDAGGLGRRLAERRPGSRAVLTLLRGDRLVEATVRLGKAPEEGFRLTPAKKPGAAARRLLKGWGGA